MKSILKRPSFVLDSPVVSRPLSKMGALENQQLASARNTDVWTNISKGGHDVHDSVHNGEYQEVPPRKSSMSSGSDEHLRSLAARGSKELSVGILENIEGSKIVRVQAPAFPSGMDTGTRPSTCGSTSHHPHKDSANRTSEVVHMARPSSSHGKFARFSKVGIAKRPSNTRLFAKPSFENTGFQGESSAQALKSGSTLHLSSFNPVQIIDGEHSPTVNQQKQSAKHDPLNVSLVLADDDYGKEATLRTANTGSSSSLDYAGDEDYFKRVQPVASNSDKFYVENEYNYNLKNFFLFYVIHMLFFNVFGLLMPLLALPFKSMRIAVKNMSFNLSLKFISIFQALLWLNTVTIVVGYFFWDFRLSGIPTVILSWVTTSMMSSIIGCKYATFPQKMVDRVFQELVPDQDTQKEHMMGEWSQQTNSAVDSEFKVSMSRNKLDLGIFWMNFLGELCPGVEELIQEFDKAKLLPYSSKKTLKTRQGSEKVYYNGKALFYIMIKYYEANEANKNVQTQTNIIGTIWGLIPFFFKLMLGLPLYNAANILDNVMFYGQTIMLGRLLSYQTWSFLRADMDVKRTHFVLMQLDNMLTKNTGLSETKRLFPTINYMDEISLNSWKIMRRVTMDYGKKFHHRFELFVPYKLLMGTAALSILCAIEVMSSKGNELLKDPEVKLQVQLMLFLVAFVSNSLIFTFMNSIAKVNEMFDTHKKKLLKLKHAFKGLLKYKSHYFQVPSCIMTPDSVSITDLFERDPNLAFQYKVADDIKTLLGPHDLNRRIYVFLDHTARTLQSCVDSVMLEQTYKSVKMLGYSVTRTFTLNLYFVILSVLFSIYQLSTN